MSETVKFDRAVLSNAANVIWNKSFYTRCLFTSDKGKDHMGSVETNKMRRCSSFPFCTGFCLIATLRSCHVSAEGSSLLVLPPTINKSSLITWNDPSDYLISAWLIPVKVESSQNGLDIKRTLTWPRKKWGMPAPSRLFFFFSRLQRVSDI